MSFQKIVFTTVGVLLGGGLVFAVTPLGRDVLFHLIPLRWTGEADRLANVLQLRPGQSVADIGAGDGALIVELARRVGGQGRAFASEQTPQRRQQIEARAVREGVAMSVIEAADAATNLPDACCDAITMRLVLHHVGDVPAFARDLRRAIRPGGRIAIIEFAPGALPHLADDHGIDVDRVVHDFTAAGFTVQMRNDQWGGRTFLLLFTAT